MAQVSTTTLNPVLKDWYTDGRVKDMTYEGAPFRAMVPKLESYGGRVYVQPIQHGENAGRSRTFTTAMSQKDTNKYKEFRVPLVKDYNMLSLDRFAMQMADGQSRKSFFEAKKREVDGTIKPLNLNIATSMYRGTGGARGVIGSLPSATVIQLATVEDIVNFEVGDEIVTSENNGDTSTDTLQAGSATITAVDRDLGRITTDGAGWVAQIALADAGDFLFKAGDFQLSCAGLAAWIPTTAPTSGESFNNVDRSVDVTRLAGHRQTSTSVSVLTAIRNMLTRMARERRSPTHVLLSPAKFYKLETEFVNKVEYTNTSVTAKVGFKGIEVVGQRGVVTCYADPNCPDNLAYVLTMDSWKLVSPKPIPEIQDDDGNIMLREPTSDGYEIRTSAYYNLVCDAPGDNGVITLTA